MEFDFDKEIDVLLRTAAEHTAPHDGGASHLDADELTAFAENALPDKARRAYTLHLADCDRCRKILSDIILIDEEAAPAAVPAAALAPVTEILPWYRRLFFGQNMAYAMGALVVIFAGFLGYSLLRSNNSASVEVSQVSESNRSFSGPNAGEDQSFAPQSANAASNTISTARSVTANSSMGNSNAAALPAGNFNSTATTAAPKPTSNPPSPPVGGGVTTATTDTIAPADQPPPPAKDEEEKSRDVKTLSLAKKEALPAAKEVQTKTENAPMAAQAEQTMGRSVARMKSAGPRNNTQNQVSNGVTLDGNETAAVKRIAGKTFEFKQGVWYDSIFDGRPTKNIRRGTSEYKKLDRNVRSIAESLAGTIVVVSNGKAYRIQ